MIFKMQSSDGYGSRVDFYIRGCTEENKWYEGWGDMTRRAPAPTVCPMRLGVWWHAQSQKQ